MKEEVERKDKLDSFSAEELDLVVCALVRYCSELRHRTSLLERFGTWQHLEKHRAKIALGEKLLEKLSGTK